MNRKSYMYVYIRFFLSIFNILSMNLVRNISKLGFVCLFLQNFFLAVLLINFQNSDHEKGEKYIKVRVCLLVPLEFFPESFISEFQILTMSKVRTISKLRLVRLFIQNFFIAVLLINFQILTMSKVRTISKSSDIFS